MKRWAMAMVAATLAVGAIGLAGCQGPAATEPGTAGAVAADSLYNRLGGESKIRAVVDDWVNKVAQDQRVNARFRSANLAEFKKRVGNQMIELAGGPKIYMGKDMKTAHRGMNISDAEWTAFLDDLKAALAEAKVGELEQQQLMVIYQPMKRDVVGQ